jgi:hypothetical protein
MLNIKTITGRICTNNYKIPFHVEVKYCPLFLSAFRIDFPVLQVNEKYDATVNIYNVSNRD